MLQNIVVDDLFDRGLVTGGDAAGRLHGKGGAGGASDQGEGAQGHLHFPVG